MKKKSRGSYKSVSISTAAATLSYARIHMGGGKYCYIF